MPCLLARGADSYTIDLCQTHAHTRTHARARYGIEGAIPEATPCLSTIPALQLFGASLISEFPPQAGLPLHDTGAHPWPFYSSSEAHRSHPNPGAGFPSMLIVLAGLAASRGQGASGAEMSKVLYSAGQSTLCTLQQPTKQLYIHPISRTNWFKS